MWWLFIAVRPTTLAYFQLVVDALPLEAVQGHSCDLADYLNFFCTCNLDEPQCGHPFYVPLNHKWMIMNGVGNRRSPV